MAYSSNDLFPCHSIYRVAEDRALTHESEVIGIVCWVFLADICHFDYFGFHLVLLSSLNEMCKLDRISLNL